MDKGGSSDSKRPSRPSGGLNHLGSDLVQNIQSFFQIGTGSPNPKRRRADGGERASTPPPFNPGQAEWLQRAVGASLTAFGEAVHIEIARVEGMARDTTVRVDANESKIAELQERLEKAEENSAKLSADLDEVKARPAPQPVPSSPASSPSSDRRGRDVGGVGEVAMDERTGAIVGNLEDSVDELLLVARAKEVLVAAGIPETQFHGLAPLCRPGGSGRVAELHFKDSRDLPVARSLARALHKQYPGGSGYVYENMGGAQTD